MRRPCCRRHRSTRDHESGRTFPHAAEEGRRAVSRMQPNRKSASDLFVHRTQFKVYTHDTISARHPAMPRSDAHSGWIVLASHLKPTSNPTDTTRSRVGPRISWPWPTVSDSIVERPRFSGPSASWARMPQDYSAAICRTTSCVRTLTVVTRMSRSITFSLWSAKR